MGYFLHSPKLEAKQQNLGENARSPFEFLRYFPALSSALPRGGGPHTTCGRSEPQQRLQNSRSFLVRRDFLRGETNLSTCRNIPPLDFIFLFSASR
ncbi:MAG: hypothetical protein WCC18_21490 [Candidatus Acidiferrales bacterium]